MLLASVSFVFLECICIFHVVWFYDVLFVNMAFILFYKYLGRVRMFLLAFLSLLISAILIPLIIKVCSKYNLYDKINVRKIHTGDIPRLGGVAVVLSFTMVISFSMHYLSDIADARGTLPLVVGGFIIFLMGVIDDFHSLRARTKLFFQCVAAFIIVFSGYRFKQLFSFSVPTLPAQIFTFFWIVCIINAFNLIDGLDALCGGLSILIMGTLYLIYARSASSAATVCIVLCGSIAGFLFFNKPPAKIFLGDGGSQFLGFVVAVCPLFYSTTNYEYNKVLIMLNLVSIPMTDTIAAIWRRTREHRFFFTPDSAHIHHKLLNIGFSKKSAVVFLLGTQFLICVSVCFAMYLQTLKGTILLCITYAFVLLSFSVLHYINRNINLNGNGRLSENPNKE